ncbi:MAG: peptide-methionine (S)-S-oxide reductase MsrA [Methanobacteriota archaeon]|nr:MAG: peptide-methionine (S)-S-oxide reductase MsrA [Euryarchaeota archaeon]
MTEEAVFAAGCFWGIEAAFRKVKGVVDTTVGYCGGHVAAPSYKDVCTGKTGHAESVRVVFDPTAVSYNELLEVFWRIHDPCSRNQQGPDVGTQYRSVIFYTDEDQRREALLSRDRLNHQNVCGGCPVATEIRPASEFYIAEEYHQRYHEKHGVRTVSCPL